MSIHHYNVQEVAPLIDWTYFFHAWKMNVRAQDEALRNDAISMINEWSSAPICHAIVKTVDAHSDGDDIIINDTRLPMLRQQHEPYLSISDFIHPVADSITLFATSICSSINHLEDEDLYLRMIAQTAADRLAEATAEKINHDVKGIRPAVGYPSMPDMSLTFLMDELLDMKQIGINLTENGAMHPHASICGLIITHPKAHYFNIGNIGEDQRHDYAQRRGYTYEQMLKFLPL